MADRLASPFSGLGMDKALLRSTAQPSATPADVADSVEPVPATAPRKQRGKLPSPVVRGTEGKPASPTPSTLVHKQASTLASYPDGAIDRIRKTVKVPGREVSFIRLSAEEKATVAEIVYTYKRRGQRISETDINRIALNFLLDDYEQHGDQSLLVKVLDALRA